MHFDQALFNIVVGFAGLCGGWILKTLWEVLRDVQSHQRKTDEKVSSLEVLVAGHYVTRGEFNKALDSISTKLDYIVDTLNQKQDRS